MMGFFIIIILMITSNAYTLFTLFTISRTAKLTLSSDVRSIDLAKQLQSSLYEQEQNAQKYLISRDKIYLNIFTEGTQRFNISLDSLAAIQDNPEDFRILSVIQRTHSWIIRTVSPIDSRSGKAPKTRDTQAAQAGLADSLETMHESLTNLIRLHQDSIDNSMSTVELMTTRSSNVALIITFCTLLLAITLAIVIAKTITRPIGVLIRGTEQIVHGSFEPIKPSSHDEIALLTTAVNDMSAQLKKDQELRSELMQEIVHELRIPVQIIIAGHYGIKKYRAIPPDSYQQKMLTTIRSGIDQLTDFINQLLDIAKIEAGMVVYEFHTIDLRVILNQVIEHAKIMVAQKEITFHVSVSTIPPVTADQNKISQVVSNLLNNATKYTNRGGNITLSITHAHPNIRIAVEDSGIGIPPEEIPKLFDKFYQGSNAQKISAKGTGLGLALVKTFIEGHRGTVTVESTVGKGSTFTIELPALQSNIPPVDSRKEHS